MRKLTLLLVLLLCLPALAQEPAPLDLSRVPMEGNTPQDFVPSGWKIETTSLGDLNKDGTNDVALELVEKESAAGAGGPAVERPRALVVLLATEGGKLRRAGASNQVLYCVGCEGMLGGGSDAGVVTIQKGVLVIDQLRGSREMVHTTLRFRYEPKEARFRLIGEDVATTDRLTSTTDSVSTNLLTGTRITEKRQYDPKKDKHVVISSVKKKVPVNKRYLSDVDISKY